MKTLTAPRVTLGVNSPRHLPRNGPRTKPGTSRGAECAQYPYRYLQAPRKLSLEALPATRFHRKQFYSFKSRRLLSYLSAAEATAADEHEPGHGSSSGPSSAVRLGVFYISYFWTQGIRLPYWYALFLEVVFQLPTPRNNSTSVYCRSLRDEGGPLKGRRNLHSVDI